MKFEIIADLLNKLEENSKRIPKILQLRDFLEKYPKEGPVIYDIIAGNFQRELDNKKIAISIKTIFSVLSFITKKSQEEIEKKFNKIGDLGKVCEELYSNKQQKSLNLTEITFEKIKQSIIEISNISGTNSNKKKKEILTNLFLSLNNKIEYKFLGRLLINDLRIGVSEGVLKEAMINTYLPKIIGIHKICSNCGYINLNLKECLKCNTNLDNSNQEELALKKYEIVELGTPKNSIGLNTYDINYQINQIEYGLRRNKDKYILKHENPREIYNNFISLFEKKYNLLNSFEKVSKELTQDLTNINKLEIKIGNPIKSMLGTRAKTIQESFEMTDKPSLIDYKYDGLRVQIHNNYGEIKLFSRNLEEITKQFPEIIEFIKTNFSDISFVIDSECVGYNYETLKFLPFQTLSKRILTKNINEVSHINIIVKTFDILYLNEETLISKPYKQRREILDKLYLNRKIKQKIHFDIKKINGI